MTVNAPICLLFVALIVGSAAPVAASESLSWRSYDAEHPVKVGPPFPIQVGHQTYLLPHYSYRSDQKSPGGPTHLILAVHGGARNASGLLENLKRGLSELPLEERSDYLIFAPQFAYPWNLSAAHRAKGYL